MTTEAQPKLSVRNLWKIYGADPAKLVAGDFARLSHAEKLETARRSRHFVAVAGVEFDVMHRQILVIMGLSGSGKSTVLRAISRLDEPTLGEVHFDGIDLLAASTRDMIEIRRRKMGMVFQSFGLLPHLDVVENVAFPLRAQGQPRERRIARAREMIDLVGLSGKERSYPHQLSGGQQQRVGIARSLAVEPELWFLDEPFSALDPLIRAQMQDEFLRLQRQLHKTIVFVTHDFLEALKLADTICIMRAGEIVQMGAPADIVLKPADDYVRDFIGDVPLAHVLRAGDIMGPPATDGREHPAVTRDSLLVDAIKLFDQNTETVHVTDEAGRVLGALHPLEVIRSLYHDAPEPLR